MAASSSSPMDRAKSGNPDAIAQLLSRSLAAKQIVTKITLEKRLLRISLVSAQTPDQQTMLELVQKGMLALQPKNVDEVEVIGQQTGKTTYDWSTRFPLTAQTKQNSRPKVVSLNGRAKQQTQKFESFDPIFTTQTPPSNKSSKPKLKNLRLILLASLMGLGLVSGVGSLLFVRHNQTQLIDRTLAEVPLSQPDSNQADIPQAVSDREKIKTAIATLESIPSFPGSLSSKAQSEAGQLNSRLSQLDQAISDQANQNWQNAQTLAQEANKQMTATHPSPTALRTARTQLEKAIALVEPIPQDVAAFTPSRTALSTYQGQLKTLDDRLVVEDSALKEYNAALNLAMEASTLTQGGAHPADIWTQAVSKWQGAISHLESVPTGTSISTDAQKRLSNYRKNLSSIQARLAAEQKATADFNTAMQLATEAVDSTQNPPHPSSIWRTAAQTWQQSINLLRGIPAGTTVSQQARGKVSGYQANLKAVNNNLQKQLAAEALERLRPQIQSVVDQFSALNSSLDVGMSYTIYSQEVRDLKIALDQLARQSGVTNLAVYQSLSRAFNKYDLALNVWRYYIESDETHSFIHASFPYGSLLISSYGVETTDIIGTPYIYLDTALSNVWSRAGNDVDTAQGQI